MSGVLSVDGLASGLDTTALIDSIMAVERRGVVLLEARQARVNNQLAAFREINTKLLAFQDTALTLSPAHLLGDRAYIDQRLAAIDKVNHNLAAVKKAWARQQAKPAGKAKT